MMRKAIRSIQKLLDGESGKSLMLVLVVLVIGSLIITPLLSLMGGGLKTTKLVYEKKTYELYAADSGVRDAMWQITHGELEGSVDGYDAYDFNTESWPYTLSEQVNGMEVDVGVGNIWIPQNIEIPDKFQARAVAEQTKLEMFGIATGGNSYAIDITYVPSEGEMLAVTGIGVWLPPGFDYVDGSCSLETALNAQRAEIPCGGGKAEIWTFPAGSVPFDSLPGFEAEESHSKAILTFQLSSDVYLGTPKAVSWMTTSGIEDIPFIWDDTIDVYRIDSAAGGTTITTYTCVQQGNPTPLSGIVCNGDVIIQPGDGPRIEGSLQYGGDTLKTPSETEITDVITGAVINEPPDWPSADYVTAYYLDQVDGAPRYDITNYPLDWTRAGNVLTIWPANQEIGPFHYTGDLQFRKNQNATVTLAGSIFIDGNLSFQTAQGSNVVDVYLNGNSIFVTGDLEILDNYYTFHGPGNVVALGVVDFKPQVTADGFISVMSVNKYVYFAPQGNFLGSVAGNTGYPPPGGETGVVIQPNGLIVCPFSGVIDGPHGSGNLDIMAWDID